MRSSQDSELQASLRSALDLVVACAAEWDRGHVTRGEVGNVVIDAIAASPSASTIDAALAKVPDGLRAEVVDRLAGLRGARVGDLFSVRSLTRAPVEDAPLAQAALDAINAWFVGRDSSTNATA